MSMDVDRLVADIQADPSAAIRDLMTFDASLSTVIRDRSLDIDVDSSGSIPELLQIEAAAAEASRDRTLNIRVNRDRDGFGALTSALNGVVGALGSVTRSASGASGALGGLASAAGGAGGGLGSLGSSASGAAGGMGKMASMGLSLAAGIVKLAAIGTLVTGVMSGLGGLFTAAAAGAGILYAAIAPLVGLLGSILPVLAGFAGAFGAILLVALPVMQAFSAMGAAKDHLAKKADDLARRQRELAAAHRSLREATIGVSRAERELKEAREKLAKAPAEAAEALSDQRLAMSAAILSEKSAILQLQQAQENLNRIQGESADSTKTIIQQTDEFTGKVYDVAIASENAQRTALEEAQARLAVKQAEQGVKEAKDNTEDTQKKLTEMEKKGIKNSDIMVQARDRLIDAEFRLAASHDAVAAAQDRIREAQERLAKGNADQSAAIRNLNDAMAKLSPAGRAFVTFLHDEFVPAFSGIGKAVQETMLPPIQEGLSALLGMSDAIENGIAQIGGTLGKGIGKFFEHWAKPENTQALTDMWDAVNDSLEAAMDLLIPFSRVLVSLTEAAAPMTTKLFEGLGGVLTRWADWMDTKKGQSRMTKFFDDALEFAKLWGGVFKGIGGVLGAISKAAKPFAKEMLEGWGKSLSDLADKLGSKKGQRTLRRFFSDAMPVLSELGETIEGIFGIFFDPKNSGTESDFYKGLKKMNDDLLPSIERIMERLQEAGAFESLAETLTTISETIELIDFEGVIGNISAFMDGLGDIIGALKWLDDHSGGGVKKAFGPAVDMQEIGDAFGTVGRKINRTLVNAGYDMESFDTLMNGENGVMWRISNGWETTWDGVENWWDTKVLPWLEGLGGEIKTALRGMWNGMWDHLEKALGGDKLSDEWSELFDWLRDDLPSLIGDAAAEMWSFLPEPPKWMKDVWGWVKDNTVGWTADDAKAPDNRPKHTPGDPKERDGGWDSGGRGNDRPKTPVPGGPGQQPFDVGGRGRNVTINQTFNERVDPVSVSRELAWELAS